MIQNFGDDVELQTSSGHFDISVSEQLGIQIMCHLF